MPPRSDQKIEDILAATEGLFRRHLNHDVTIEEIARGAKVSKGTIYTYFPDKDELLFQAEVFRMNNLVTMLENEVPSHLPFIQRLQRIVEETASYFDDRIPILSPRKWLHGPPSEEQNKIRRMWRDARSILIEYLSGVLGEGISEGALPEDLEVRTAASYLMILIRARRFEQIADPTNIPTVSSLLQMYLFGITRAGKYDLAALVNSSEGIEA